MDMKMILFAILLLAASMTATMAATSRLDVPAPGPAPVSSELAAAPSESAATMPVAGSLVGAFLLSVFGLLFQ